MIYDVIDDVMPDHFNKYMIEALIQVNRWRQALPELHSVKKDTLVDDAGMTMLSFPNEDEDHKLNRLNILCDVILNGALERHSSIGRFENFDVDRYVFNLYNRNSVCDFHQDVTLTGLDPGQYLSTFIYSFNDCDGYNIIADEKIESKAGRLILFPSNVSHKAYPPKNQPHRYSLNCQFKYSSYFRYNDNYGTE